MTESTQDSVDQSSPFQSPKFIVGAIFVAILVGLGIWLGVSGSDKDSLPTDVPPVAELGSPDTQTPPVLPEPSPEPTTNDDAPGGSASVCGLAPGDQSVPFDGFDTTKVVVGQRLTVPGVDGVGPGITDGISRCFAHSPRGAILAAANFITWTSSQQQLPEMLETLILQDSRSGFLLQQARDEWDGSSGSPFLIHGYSYDYQGENDALVVLAVSMFDHPGQYIGFPVALTWAEGDWKVVVPATYAWGEYPITSLEHEGYVRWGE